MKNTQPARGVVSLFLCLFMLTVLCQPVLAQTTYVTDFESPTFTLGNVQGQNGWGYLPNSPAKGVIEPAPPGSPASFGAQSLAIRNNTFGFLGVTNQLFSARVDAAGETGSTLAGVVVAAPYNFYQATFYYQAPLTPVISTRDDGRFAELDPSSKGTAAGDPPNRYAQIRVINTTNGLDGKVRLVIGWFTNADQTLNVVTVADQLNWGQWYRLDYRIRFCDGLQGLGPNDTFRIDVSDANGGVPIGTVIGSTWESAWKTGNFGGGTTPRAVNGFDLWTQTNDVEDTLVGYIDNFAEHVQTIGDPCSLPTAGGVTVSGRVLNGRGGVANARVGMTESDGTTRATVTDITGRYTFDEITAGQSVSLQVSKRGLVFSPRIVSITDNLTDLDFIAGRIGAATEIRSGTRDH